MNFKIDFCLLLAVLFLSFTFILNISEGGSSFQHERKRGYLLDRAGEPLVINKERFEAYLLIDGSSLLGKDWPEELRPYLIRSLDLPKRGLFLISESLTFEEIDKLKKVRNVVIRGEIKREILYPELRGLIGLCVAGDGITGLEKIFDKELKEGESKRVSLDLNLSKKIYNYFRILASPLPTHLAVFKRDTGELLVFFSKEEKNFLTEPFLVRDNLFNEDLKTMWELGSVEAKRKGNLIYLAPLNIVQTYLSQACGTKVKPTLLPVKERLCDITDQEKDGESLYLYLPHKRQWLAFIVSDDYLFVFSDYFQSGESGEDNLWEVLKKRHKYLVNLITNS
ncbi:MAG: hypothetical protein N2327_03625 [Caldimicrobium sp.]|nr:hypothetical protein [Caldimicrobium sp.]MCX7873507.1 hypothetical protein [Caldimicrobium sp.]MDW8093833.1 hypothetical protein [Caldimicrobium sp.]